MKRFLIFCILTLSATGDQEHSPPSAKGDSLNKLLSDPSLSDLLNDPDLWLILKKRLGTPMECLANSRRNNSIIKTKDSLDAGAKFITAPTVQTEKECEKECCKEESCNTVVLKIKVWMLNFDNPQWWATVDWKSKCGLCCTVIWFSTCVYVSGHFSIL